MMWGHIWGGLEGGDVAVVDHVVSMMARAGGEDQSHPREKGAREAVMGPESATGAVDATGKGGAGAGSVSSISIRFERRPGAGWQPVTVTTRGKRT